MKYLGEFIPPTLTTIERDALTGVSSGSIIYNTTTNKLEIFKVTTWVAFDEGSESSLDSFFGIGTSGDIEPQIIIPVIDLNTLFDLDLNTGDLSPSENNEDDTFFELDLNDDIVIKTL